MQLSLYRGKWAAVWTEKGAVKRRSLGTEDRAEAEAAYDRFLRARAGRPSTVKEAVRAYVQVLLARGGSEGGSYAADRIEESILGPLGLDEITAERCQAYAKARRKEGRADGTIIKELAVLRAALNDAKPKHGSSFWFPPTPRPRDKRLTKPQFEQLLAGAGSPHMRLFLELASSTGARAGAIVALRWKQVDLAHRLIDLRGDAVETSKRRATVPMTDQVRQQLEALHAALHPAPEDPVIIYRGKPIKNPKRAFQRAVERSGLEGVTPHVIRHSVACWMAEGGVPMPEIAAFLGHTDSRVTERVYAKFSPAYLRKAVSALNREFPPVQSEQSGLPDRPQLP